MRSVVLTRWLLLALAAACAAVVPVRGQATPDGELAALLDRALGANPQVLAAKCRVEEALQKHREVLAFFDPTLFAAGGTTRRGRGVPGGTGWTALTDDAHELAAGIEVPLRPGAYLSFGAAETLLFDGGAGYDQLYQSLLGVRLRVPLLRDRGFVQFDQARLRALAEYDGAANDLIGVMQTLRHEVELAYVDAYSTLASCDVAKRATERFRVLLEQARELSRLKVMPAYQVFPAEMELSLRQEEEQQARQVHEVSLIRLQQSIGDGLPVTLGYGPERLVELAAGLGDLSDVDLEQCLERHGSYRRLLNLIDAARADQRQALDDLRPDLSLNAAVNWRAEDPELPFASHAILSDEPVGGELVVVWQQPLMHRAATSRLSGSRARISELKHEIETERSSLKADMQSAMEAYKVLSGRLKLLAQAKEAAQQTVAAEDERFRLGEGTSRNALDAQKDLTTTLNRQASAAADILRALADYRHAAGYPGGAAQP
jgi:outer membrane protein TolC